MLANLLTKERLRMTTYRHTYAIAILMLATLLGGCGAKQQISRVQSLADSGIVYADSLTTLTSSACGTITEWNSRALLGQSDALSKVSEAPAKAQLASNLEENDAAIREVAESCRSLRAHLAATRSYFAALKAFAEYGFPESMKTQISTLVTTVDGLNATATLAEDKKTAIEGLAQTAAESVKANLLEKVIREDAASIATSLAWQEALLDSLHQTYVLFAAANGEAIYAAAVREPFVTRKITDRNAWVTRRGQLLLEPDDTATLIGAQKAAAQMGTAWALAVRAPSRQ